MHTQRDAQHGAHPAAFAIDPWSFHAGDRKKETEAINSSLSYLKDVIMAIRSKQSHVPFRNSTLTRLLEPSMRGDAKVLMLVNVSPAQESTQETLSSLRFASTVNDCEVRRWAGRGVLCCAGTSESCVHRMCRWGPRRPSGR